MNRSSLAHENLIMAARPEQLLDHIRRLASASEVPTADADLLAGFVRDRDEESFAVLVRRHGPMVLGVCRRILGNVHDAEDAFQAAFLVLARKADSVKPRHALTAWLYGVARRVALKARTTRTRQCRAMQAIASPCVDPHPSPLDELSARELLAIFDEELQRLPRTYRLPLILCCIEGRSQEEAARQLGWTAGSVKGRLERGRARLHDRLLRRGLALSAALMVVEATRTHLFAGLAKTTVQESMRFVSGGATGAAVLLAEAALRGMAWSRAAFWAALLSAVAIVAGTGTLVFSTRPPESEPPSEPSSQQVHQPEPRRDQHGDPLPPRAIARLGTVRLRREDQTTCDFAFTPDGKALVSARNARVVQFWDVKTGKPLQAFRHQNAFGTFALSANGKLLATGSREEILVWDVARRKQLRTIAAKDAYESLIVFSPNNESLASFSTADWIIHLWDIASGKKKRQFALHKEAFAGMQFFSDGKTLIGAEHSAIRFWDVATGREIRSLAPLGNVGCIALSGDDALLASGGREIVKNAAEGRLVLWDAATGRKLRLLKGHKHAVDAVAFSPDGKTLASAEVETIYLWDVKTGKEIRRIENSGWIKHRLVFAPDGKTLASTAPGNETVIRLWDVATGKALQPAGPDGVVRTVALSPDGRFAATGCWLGNDAPLRIWDAATGKPLWNGPAPDHEGYINRVVFTPDGKALFSSSIDGMVRLWDAQTGKTIRKYPLPECRRTVVELALSTDGQRLTAIGKSMEEAWSVVVWDVHTGKRLLQREGRHPSFLNIPSFSADAKIIAEPEGKILRLYEVSTGQLLLHLETSTRWPGRDMEESVAFSPDGRTVATLTSTAGHDKKGDEAPDRVIHLWELASGKPTLRIVAGKDRLHAVAFAPDGRTLATAGKGVLQLWDVATGKQLLNFQGQESQVWLGALAFSRDGTRLAAGYCDSTALVWDLTPGLRRLKAIRSTRSLEDLPQQWSDLFGDDAAKAHTAIWTLIAAPDKATRLLKDHLKPVEPVDTRRVRRLMVDLDSSEFAVRESATKELKQIGEKADPLLRETLEKKPTLEVRRRIEELLVRPRFPIAGESLRGVRAIQVLENLGTPEARTLLRKLAEGAAGARVTEQARESLNRIEKRTSP